MIKYKSLNHYDQSLAPETAQRQPSTSMEERIIEPNKRPREYFKDIWRYRELFFFLAWRDILVRYKQTFIGMAWAIFRPLLTLAAFTIVFGKLAKLPSDGVPYPIFVFSALLPWQLFATVFGQSSESVVANAHLVTKVYFPRIIIPATSVVVSLVDFLISSFLLAILMVWYGYIPGARILSLPFFIIIALSFALGGGLWISSLTVKYRDFRYIVPLLLQVGLYISPVGFTSSLVPERWRLIFSLNPMVGVIDGFRWAVVGTNTLDWRGLVLSVSVVITIVLTGLLRFRKVERTFPDII